MVTCRNCKFEYEGNFCSHCGQPASTHELNFHYLWHDIQHGVLHFDKGLPFTLRQLFSRPGHAIRDFIEGKRTRYFKPISLVLILAGIYGFLSHYFHIDVLEGIIVIGGSGPELEHANELLKEANEWIAGHYAVVALLQIPVYALSTRIAFKGYNYVEHLVLNSYLGAQRLVLRIVFFPVYYLLDGTPGFARFAGYVTFLNGVLALWTLLQFFHHTPKWTTFWRTVLSMVIFWFFFVLLVGGAMVLVYWLNIKPA